MRQGAQHNTASRCSMMRLMAGSGRIPAQPAPVQAHLPIGALPNLPLELQLRVVDCPGLHIHSWGPHPGTARRQQRRGNEGCRRRLRRAADQVAAVRPAAATGKKWCVSGELETSANPELLAPDNSQRTGSSATPEQLASPCFSLPLVLDLQHVVLSHAVAARRHLVGWLGAGNAW